MSRLRAFLSAFLRRDGWQQQIGPRRAAAMQAGDAAERERAGEIERIPTLTAA
jgi:hypothetical protein